MLAKVFKVFSFPATIKSRMILGFSLIVIVMGSISIGSFFIIRSFMLKFDNMVQTTITANEINNSITKIPEHITAFINAQDNIENADNLTAEMRKMQDNIILLRKIVSDKKIYEYIDSVERFSISIQEDIEGVFSSESKDEALKHNEHVKTILNLSKTNVDKLIAAELNSQLELKEQISNRANIIGVIVILVILCVSLISIIGSTTYSSKIGGIINKLSISAQSITDGNLKIEHIKTNSKDDLALLAQGFNKMVENLCSIISKISDTSENVANSAEYLKSGSEQNTKTIEQIAASIMQVSLGASKQQEQSEMTVEVTKNQLERSNKIYDNSRIVLGTAVKASEAAEIGNDKVTELIDQIGIIQEKIVSTQEIAESLKKKSSEIRIILDAITNIASKTNLLALNAAIEAARAGEHGRGFAIVADEIRKLAGASANSVEGITEMLNEIQNQTEQVAERMGLGVDEISEGIEMAEKARKSFEEIVSTNRDVDTQVRQITEEIEQATIEIQTVEEMNRIVHGVARQFMAESQEIASAVQEQSAGQEEISSSAAMLSDSADELKKVIREFRL